MGFVPENHVRTRLPAGAKGIRTLGPVGWVSSVTPCAKQSPRWPCSRPPSSDDTTLAQCRDLGSRRPVLGEDRVAVLAEGREGRGGGPGVSAGLIGFVIVR